MAQAGSGAPDAAALHAAVRAASCSVVGSLQAAGWGPADMGSLPLGVALPLQEALQRCRADPPQGARVCVCACGLGARGPGQARSTSAALELLCPVHPAH